MSRHELIFENPNGMVLSIATEDIEELSKQEWFMRFFDDAKLQQARVQPQPRQVQNDPYAEYRSPQQPTRPVQVPQPSYLDVSPDRMTPEYWARLSPQQQAEWQAKWLRRQV